MSLLPETATRKGDRRWPWYVLAAMAIAALSFVGVELLRGGGFSPGEEMNAPGFEDIAVSAENTSYPASDVLRFDERPEVLYVYLVVEDLQGGRNLEARIERSGTQSLMGWLLEGGDDLEVSDEQEELLRPSGDGVSGVVQFVVRTASGEPLPAGDYTVSVYARQDGAAAREAAARKYFVIRV